ncbi:FecR family protein [Chitinophaga niastensis]|uniref:FecR family protein n=1 Tax=Chitinophaga niastensis TaxID=536980 RepID=A0A2P8HVW6_CHINA|nr:FecR family protein [Chitinophaga niastensis]PSL50369.1 FecR family protein [Chitinophaga niastensis]
MQDRLLELFHKYVNDSCSEEELSELFDLFSLPGNKITVKELIAQTIEDIYQHPEKINILLSNTDAENVLSQILTNTPDIATKTDRQPKKLFSRWRYQAAAAMVAALVGVSYYYYAHRSVNTPLQEVAQTTPNPLNITSGGNKATLTLNNGQTIVLDSAQNGLLAMQGTGRIVKPKSGEIIYSTEEKNDEKILYNNISTPRGGQYSLQLSDGSKVWLNAASSIRFPVVFPATERKVYITGEAYFEVKHLVGARDQSVPFIVEADNKSAGKAGFSVEVLGTRFNINSYSNEPFASTTLLEGKVKVQSHSSLQTRLLSPNQQVNMARNGEMNLNEQVDVNSVIAWKNGYSQFSAVPLSAVMRQIERWYDVNVQFEDHVTDVKFTGKLKRNENLSEFLKILDLNNIKYAVNNSTIIIKK